MSSTVQASDGTQLPLDSLPVAITYSGSFVSLMEVSYQGKNFQQVFVNDGSNITYISNWNYVAPGSVLIYDEAGDLILTDDTNQPIYTG